MQKSEIIKRLVLEYVKQWVAAGKYVLPDAHDCLEFIVTEAAEALQAKMRLNQTYVRNTPKVASERDIAMELFDTMKMCIVYEYITGQKLEDSKANLSGTNFKSLHRIVHMSAKALVLFDKQTQYHIHDLKFLLGRVFFLSMALIEKFGFDPMEIAQGKLTKMNARRDMARHVPTE